MDYLRRIKALQVIDAEIRLQLTKAISEMADQQKIDEHYHLLKQIDVEISRIENMRGYTTARPKKN